MNVPMALTNVSRSGTAVILMALTHVAAIRDTLSVQTIIPVMVGPRLRGMTSMQASLGHYIVLHS